MSIKTKTIAFDEAIRKAHGLNRNLKRYLECFGHDGRRATHFDKSLGVSLQDAV